MLSLLVTSSHIMPILVFPVMLSNTKLPHQMLREPMMNSHEASMESPATFQSQSRKHGSNNSVVNICGKQWIIETQMCPMLDHSPWIKWRHWGLWLSPWTTPSHASHWLPTSLAWWWICWAAYPCMGTQMCPTIAPTASDSTLCHWEMLYTCTFPTLGQFGV